MRLPSLVILVFFLQTLGTFASSIDAIVASFKTDFRKQLVENNIPGGAYAIIRDGQVIAMEGVGVRALGSKEMVDKNTVFRLASVSKTFAAGLAAQMVEENKFSWNDKIIDYVPEFRFKSKKYSSNLTVDHIMSQSSSLVHNAYDNLIEANYPMPKIIDKFKDIDPMCDLGKCYGYQNVLYSLIQPVIERSAKSSYIDLMHNHIFDPLEMERSSLGYEAFLETPNHAAPHVLTRKGWVKTKVKPSYYNVLPAAGVNASVEDMSKWMLAQMGSFPETYSSDVIKMVTEKRIRTLKEMGKRSWRSVLKNAHYGYGWRIYDIGGGELIYHGGSVAGFRSEVAYSMEKGLALVILLNAETRMGSELNSSFWSKVFKEKPQTKITTNSQKKVKINRSIVPRDKPASILTFK